MLFRSKVSIVKVERLEADVPPADLPPPNSAKPSAIPRGGVMANMKASVGLRIEYPRAALAADEGRAAIRIPSERPSKS